MGVHVHEMTLCVTFGARHFTDHFRFIMRCSKYIVICMVSETRVLQTALCVTFGARLCSVPWGHLGRLVAAPAARNAQETPNGTVGHPFGVASIIRRSLSDLTSECWRLHPSFRWRTSSVGGSAMHMKRPDDVGREAGSGTTQDWNGPNVFRACP